MDKFAAGEDSFEPFPYFAVTAPDGFAVRFQQVVDGQPQRADAPAVGQCREQRIEPSASLPRLHIDFGGYDGLPDAGGVEQPPRLLDAGNAAAYASRAVDGHRLPAVVEDDGVFAVVLAGNVVAIPCQPPSDLLPRDGDEMLEKILLVGERQRGGRGIDGVDLPLLVAMHGPHASVIDLHGPLF